MPLSWHKMTPEQKDKARAKRKRWAAANPEKLRAAGRKCRLKTMYGLTQSALDERLSVQGGCAICQGQEPGGHGAWHVDHDHACCPGRYTCGKCVRGILCSGCNVGIGALGDDPVTLQRAALYLLNAKHARA